MKNEVVVVKPKSVACGNIEKNELATFDTLYNRLEGDIKQFDLKKNQSGKSFGELFERVFKDISLIEKQLKASEIQAKTAKDIADKASKEHTGIGHKKKAMESMQVALVELGKSGESNAKSDKLMFGYIQLLAEFSKRLVGLGCISMAMNRAAIRELELKLRKASTEELSDLAREKLADTVRQLKQYQDIISNQKELQENVISSNNEIKKMKSLYRRKNRIDAAKSKEIDLLKKYQICHTVLLVISLVCSLSALVIGIICLFFR